MEEQTHRGSAIGTVRVLDLGSENVPEDFLFFFFSIKLHALLLDVNITLWKLQ